MAHIVLLHHRYDSFRRQAAPSGRASRYIMGDVLTILAARGHRITVTGRPDRMPSGDLLILHVDCSVVPPEYLAAAAAFPAAINAKVGDITKRSFSTLLVGRDSDWAGKVIIKSNLNYRGKPEQRQNYNAAWRLARPPHPGLRVFGDYRICGSIADVPDGVWSDPGAVVEKFVGEETEEGYVGRTYLFCGTSERCSRHVSTAPIVKSRGIVHSAPTEVPDSIRAIRHRMGFDYGKFDFVMADGQAVLFDANKTIGNVTGTGALAERIRALNGSLADGVESFLKPAR